MIGLQERGLSYGGMHSTPDFHRLHIEPRPTQLVPLRALNRHTPLVKRHAIPARPLPLPLGPYSISLNRGAEQLSGKIGHTAKNLPPVHTYLLCALERSVQRHILGLPDAASQIRSLAAAARLVHERGADVYHIVRGAAAADEDFAAVMHRRQSQLWADMRSLADAMAGRGELAPNVTAERAADILWALAGPETYRLFVIDRSWPPEEYERWLVETLMSAVLRRRDEPPWREQ